MGNQDILKISNLNVYYDNKKNLVDCLRGRQEKRLQHVLKNVSFDMKREIGRASCRERV